MADRFRRVDDPLQVKLGDELVGAVVDDQHTQLPVFEYASSWLAGPAADLAPLMLPASPGVKRFPQLRGTSFRGLPGLLADSLPGMFADDLTNSWFARSGYQPGEITAVDRLAYLGDRAMGALRFEPREGPDDLKEATAVELSRATTAARQAVNGDLRDDGALRHLLDISGSAGGARPKVLLAWDGGSNHRSGQVDAPDGYQHWLFKLDIGRGVPQGQPTGLGRLEYAYHLMAVDAGLTMQPCQLVIDGELAHFATKRFDRRAPRDRVHVQSLAAMAHLLPLPGAHGYEQYLQTCQRLRLPHAEMLAAFRQVVFNVASANRDDHTKNLAFLHVEDGWHLAPSYDLTFPYDTDGGWPVAHQMTIGGRTDGADRATLLDLAERAKIPSGSASEIIDAVVSAVGRWTEHAEAAGVLPHHRDEVAGQLARTPLA